jgi:cysteine-rich repeat protein
MTRGVLLVALGGSCGCNAIFGIDDLVPGGSQPSVTASVASAGGSTASAGGKGGMPGQGGGQGGAPGICGDGAIDAGEECDDGALLDDDGCDATCVVECEGGSLAVKHPTTFHCYIGNISQSAWGAARDACLALGPGVDLVAVSSEEESTFMLDHVPIMVSAWTGGNDQMTEGDFVWSNGEAWSYEPWLGAQPDGDGNCVLGSVDGIEDRPCFQAQYYVCERTPAGT